MVFKILHFLLSLLAAVILFYLILIVAICGISLLVNPFIGIPALLLFIAYQIRKWIGDSLKEEYNDD